MILTSQYRRTGYLHSDDTASGGQLIEADITTCAHCQRILLKRHWRFDGAWCGRCAAPVCSDGPCAVRTDRQGCLAFLMQVDATLERHYRQQQNARVLGL